MIPIARKGPILRRGDAVPASLALYYTPAVCWGSVFAL
jgi:hypothetical protein